MIHWQAQKLCIWDSGGSRKSLMKILREQKWLVQTTVFEKQQMILRKPWIWGTSTCCKHSHVKLHRKFRVLRGIGNLFFSSQLAW